MHALRFGNYTARVTCTTREPAVTFSDNVTSYDSSSNIGGLSLTSFRCMVTGTDAERFVAGPTS